MSNRYPFTLASCIILICSLLPLRQACAAYTDGARFAFAASPSTRSITVIDLHKQALAGSIAVEKPFANITASDKLKALVITNPSTNSLTLIDLLSPELDSYEYPLSLSPDYIRLSPLGDTLAVYDRTEKILEVHAIRRRQTLVRIDNVNTETEMTFTLDGSGIYWLDRSTGRLHTADLWSNTESVVLSERGHRLSALSRSIDGRLGFVSDADADAVYVIELESMQLVKRIDTGADPGRPWGTMDGTGILVPNYGDNSITVLSALSLEALHTLDAVTKPSVVTTGWLDTTAAVIGENGDIGLLDLDSGEPPNYFQFSGAPGDSVITSDSRLFAVSFDNPGKVAIFDMQNRALLTTLSDLPPINGLALAVSGNLCH